MAFESIPPLPSSQTVLDSALAAGRRKRVARKRGEEDLIFRRKRERERLTAISTELSGRLRSIPKGFPDTDNLNEFYRQLIELQFSLDDLRRHLGRVQQSSKVVASVAKSTRGRIEGSHSSDDVKKAMGSFIGRISSLLNQLDESFAWLAVARTALRQMPTIKELPTLCIAGFPNVGKTTLFVEITGAGAEVNSYAFTTKRLNSAVITVDARKIQIIDTPGTLNRESMNEIERQAELAMKYVADQTVYVYDPTPTYSLEKQDKLLEHVKTFRAPVTPLVSKLDLIDEERKNFFVSERDCITKSDIDKIINRLK